MGIVKPEVAAPSETSAVAPALGAAAGARQRCGWLRRVMVPRRGYAPMGVEVVLQGTTSTSSSATAAAAPEIEVIESAMAAAAGEGAEEKAPRRRGWSTRKRIGLPPADYVNERRLRWWKKLQCGSGGGGGSASRLVSGLSRSVRWKQVSVSLRTGSWATATLDTVAFRVMYVVEAVVLGLALSCFYCCCGCQI